jgi:hypothetical protein
MRCLVTAGKHVSSSRSIARQLHGKWIPTATDRHTMDYNNGNGVFYMVRAEMI